MNTKTSTTVVSHNVDVSTTRSSSSVSTVSTTYTNNVTKSTKSYASGTINLSDSTTPTKTSQVRTTPVEHTHSFSLTTFKRIFTKFVRRVYRSFSMAARKVKRSITLEKWQ